LAVMRRSSEFRRFSWIRKRIFWIRPLSTASSSAPVTGFLS